MPIEEKDLDKVFDLRCKYFLRKMEAGKFYSYDELKELILENSLHEPQLLSFEGSISKVLDMTYVEAVIQAQYAVGNLKCGEKNGQRYYAKT